MNMREIMNLIESAIDSNPKRPPCQFGAIPQGPEGPCTSTIKPHKTQKSVTKPQGPTPTKTLGENAVDAAEAVLASAEKRQAQADYNASVQKINSSNCENKGEKLAKANEKMKKKVVSADNTISASFERRHNGGRS
ncbi:MAG: hypothetical protein KGJ57_04755 [Sphingomonadales bacterium]|nr:hypothetical protein [Sphingomonadales bacterium]MDE2168725.1 hypothetical protein [Sphingomonadales bacterium]